MLQWRYIETKLKLKPCYDKPSLREQQDYIAATAKLHWGYIEAAFDNMNFYNHKCLNL